MPLLKYVAEPETSKILKEIHKGFCGGHTRGHSLAQKFIRQGYFWPTLKTDALDYVKKCDKCQRFADIPVIPSITITETRVLSLTLDSGLLVKECNCV